MASTTTTSDTITKTEEEVAETGEEEELHHLQQTTNTTTTLSADEVIPVNSSTNNESTTSATSGNLITSPFLSKKYGMKSSSLSSFITNTSSLQSMIQKMKRHAINKRNIFHGTILIMAMYLLITGPSFEKEYNNANRLSTTTSSSSSLRAGQKNLSLPQQLQSQLQLGGGGEKKKGAPKIAWLMSFPNSGTTYTAKLVQMTTEKSVASNYGHEHINELGGEDSIYNMNQQQNMMMRESIPVFMGDNNGPFRVGNPNLYPLPNENEFVLTKTHCAGYCFSDCPPNWYIYSPEKYLNECSRGARYFLSSSNNNNNNEENEKGESLNNNMNQQHPQQLQQEWVQYDPKIVQKAVHLFRDPFENIISRFFYERFKNTSSDTNNYINPQWQDQYPPNEQGFRRWCMDSDRRFSPDLAFQSEKTSFDNSFVELASKTLCYSEVIKYAQWHNNAFAVTHDLGVPSLIVHYKDYILDLDGTLEKMLNFLNLEQVLNSDSDEKKVPLPLERDSYKIGSYYTKEEMDGIATFMKYLSSPETYDEIAQYFEGLEMTQNVEIDHHINEPVPDTMNSMPLQPQQPQYNEGEVHPEEPFIPPQQQQQATPPQQQQQPEQPLPNNNNNKIPLSWLMSFPNSGTTYTEKLIQTVTDYSVATNYGHEYVNEMGEEERLSESIPVFASDEENKEEGLNGPFKLSSRPLPTQGYLLTKTHCGGYCFSDCPPNWYIYSPEEYLEECLRGARYAPSTSEESESEGEEGSPPKTEQIWVQYNRQMVQKAVHLFRDPYDNIVSRFNHEHKTNTNTQNDKWLELYPRNEQGFQKWCFDANQRFKPSDTFHSEKTTFDRQFLEFSEGVPCFAEFIKYTQWHNNAFETVDRLLNHIPSHIVHYEDYNSETFDQTLDGILNFVELKPKDAPPPFSMKPYTSFYTEEERVKIALFIKYLASEQTWNELTRYFSDGGILNGEDLVWNGSGYGGTTKAQQQQQGETNTAVASVQQQEQPLPNNNNNNKISLAWLMSFPNSGTTYTEKLVGSITQYTVATNYGHEHVNKHGTEGAVTESIPVFPSDEEGLNGPFKLYDLDIPPDGYLLTKTHCGGYCFSDCPPNWYLLNAEKFLVECLKGARYTINDGSPNPEQTWVQYDPNLVRKAVHLFRDPFDNIIARFHHEHKSKVREGDEEFAKEYEYNADGFRKWCQTTNDQIKPTDTFYSERANFDRTFLEVSENVPCYSEFIKYTQWHNNAFQVQKYVLHLPYIVLKYESYAEDFDGTVNRLLGFIKQTPSPEGETPEFKYHPYEGFYSQEDRNNIAVFLKYLANEETWEFLEQNYMKEMELEYIRSYEDV